MSSVTRSLLTLKIRELNEFSSFEDQAKARAVIQARNDLWKFIEKTMNNVCQAVDADSELKISDIEFLSLVSQKYTVEDFSKKLVCVFLEMEECYLLNVDLNLLLMQNGIISVAEWDKQLATFIHNSPGQLQESELRFLAEFLDRSVLSSRFL